MVQILLLELDELAFRRSPSSSLTAVDVDVLRDGVVVATAVDRSPRALPGFSGVAAALEGVRAAWDVTDAAGHRIVTVRVARSGGGDGAVEVLLADGTALGRVETRGTFAEPVWRLCGPQGEVIGAIVPATRTDDDPRALGVVTGGDGERLGVLLAQTDAPVGYDLRFELAAGTRIRALTIAHVLATPGWGP